MLADEFFGLLICYRKLKLCSPHHFFSSLRMSNNACVIFSLFLIVPILPNLFLGKCQSELAHMHYNMAETQYRDDHVCSEELSMDLQTLCTVDTEHDRWKIAFMIDGTNQVCWTAAFDDDVFMTSLHNLSRRTNQTLECFEIPLTADICREWEDCEKEINVKVGVILSSKFLMRILLSPLLAVLPK